MMSEKLEWHVVTLEEIAEITGGGTPKREVHAYWNGNIPWATPTDITNNNKKVIEKTAEYITEEGLKNSSAKLLPAGTVLMTSRATIGYCAINTVPMATNQGFANFICKNNVYNLFLLYLLTFHKDNFEKLGSGSTFKEVAKSTLKSYRVEIPPLPEQHKIAAILSSVDEAIEKTEAIIEQTEKVKKGLMQQLLTKGIGHTKFKKTEIGEIPEEWRIVKLSDILKIKHGFAFKSEHFVNSGSYLLLTPGNFKANGGLQLKGEKEKYYNGEFPKEFLLKQGDLLIVLTDLTPECKILGSPAIIPEDNKYLHNQRLGKVVNLDDNRVKKSFLFYFMNSYRYRNHLRNTATGTTVRHTSPDKIYDVSMALPSIEEQEKIVKVLSSFDMRIEKEHKKLEILLAVKKGLMQSLLTGKVRVKVDEDEVVSS
jgi:type I restriction enzyme S subunit